ncbi:MAG: galactokinase [Terracidiphilus sp.]|jgi:D-glycero-alpha-D-manno-heptose-7-phosphate kinase
MILARAPFRISIGGGGTDLPSYYSRFGGFVLGAAINQYVYVYVNRSSIDDYIRVKYSRAEEVHNVAEIQHDLIRPVLEMLELGTGLEIVSMADLPAGTGLGSSSTYLVATLVALLQYKREHAGTQDLAEMACNVEMNMARHPVGKQDHYMAAFGGFTCIDIDTEGRVNATQLQLSKSVMEEFRSSVLLFYTGLTRSSHTILQAQNKDTQREDPAVVNSLHKTKELGYRVKDAIEHGDIETFGLLLDEHWQNKKARSSAVSTPEIDEYYRIAKESGALGGKIMGAGGGGFLMLYCPNGRKECLRANLHRAGLRELSYDFDMQGAKVLVNF